MRNLKALQAWKKRKELTILQARAKLQNDDFGMTVF